MLDPIIKHRNVMLAALGCTVVALVLRLWRKNQLAGAVYYAYLGFLLVATALMSLGGHLGGKLVFGEDYLPF